VDLNGFILDSTDKLSEFICSEVLGASFVEVACEVSGIEPDDTISSGVGVSDPIN
jgi:hypothetical protein